MLEPLSKIKYSHVLVAVACVGLLLGWLAPAHHWPKWMSWAALSVVLLVAGACAWQEGQKNRCRVVAFLAGRESLGDDEFARRFFSSEKADIAVRLRSILRPYLRCNLGCIHADDQLIADLGLGADDGLDAVEVVKEIERAYGIVITDEAATEMRTLRDVVDYVAAYVKGLGPDLGIAVQRRANRSFRRNLRVKTWPIWEKEVSEFPWHYDEAETCYLLEGDVIVTPDGGEPVHFGKGDLVTFPKGMSCTWKVLKPVRKHYRFG